MFSDLRGGQQGGVAETLARHNEVVVRQSKSWTEVFTNLETASRFAVSSMDGTDLWAAAEVKSGFLGFLARMFLKASRPFTLELRGPDGQSVLRIDRPWRFWMARIDVVDGGGQAIGAVQERFAFFSRRYDLLDASGLTVASLHGPMFRPWTFNVLVNDAQAGVISKKWSGFGKEMFTDADNYRLSFEQTTPGVRALMLAATFLIDFRHFEHKS